jgi:hypothetical protein
LGEEPVERSTRYPAGLPVAGLHVAVIVEAVTAEKTRPLGCAVGTAAMVVALVVGADAVR